MQNSSSVDPRKTLVTVLALAMGALVIVVCSLMASDSVTGGAPSGFIIFVRLLVLTLTAGIYAGVLLFYSKRNAAFREKLDAAASAPVPGPAKKKKKRK